MELDQIDGFWVRPGTTDRGAVSDTRRLAKYLRPGDRVLDLGAHIGTFTGRAFRAGAVRARAVEPVPANLEILEMNIDHPLCEVFPGVATGGASGGTCTLYVNDREDITDSSTIASKRGRHPIEVPAWSLEELCKGLDPTFIKCDIEGGEYSLDLLESFPETADRLFMEYHFKNSKNRTDAAALRLAIMVDLGFDPVWSSPLKPTSWWHEEMYMR